MSCLFANTRREAPANRWRPEVSKCYAQDWRRTAPYILLEEAVELLFAILHAHAVSRVDDPDQGVSLLEIVPPVRAESALATDVP